MYTKCRKCGTPLSPYGEQICPCELLPKQKSKQGGALKMSNSKKTAPATPQASQPFTPWSTEQKKEYGKQFSAKERASFYKGKESAYRHSANMAGRQAKFIREQDSK